MGTDGLRRDDTLIAKMKENEAFVQYEQATMGIGLRIVAGNT